MFFILHIFSILQIFAGSGRVLFLNSPVVADFHVMCPVFILFYTKNTFLRARLKNRNVSDVILKMYVTNVIVS